MKITLFTPCFIDSLFPNVGISVVKILERLGHRVECPEPIICCGQPAFNSGYWNEARSIACPILEKLKRAEVVVVPSGSCGAMLKVFYPKLFAGMPQAEDAKILSHKVWEFSDFLVSRLDIIDVGAKFPHSVTFHDGCHGLRELHTKRAPRKLLANVRGLKLIEMDATEVCCGFGGAFAVKFPAISTAMGEVKCASAKATKASYVVSNDSSCLMHIQGLANRQRQPFKTMHLAEVLAQQ